VKFDGTGFRIALYSSDGATLITSLITTINISDSNTVKEFTVPSASITLGDYLIAYDALGNNDDVVFVARGRNLRNK